MPAASPSSILDGAGTDRGLHMAPQDGTHDHTTHDLAMPSTLVDDGAGTTPDDAARQRLVAAAGLVERRERLAGIDTSILEGGDGPPMVLLHGQGEYWAVWLPVIDELRTTHRLVLVDLPGHGASTAGHARLDRDRVHTWLDELVTMTCAQPPVLVGHLLGGAIAARWAVDRGDRLAHLVLVDTLGLGWFRPAARFAVPMVRFMVRPTPRSRDRLFHECLLDFDRVADNFGDRWDDLLACALAGAQRPTTQSALRALMPRFGVPPIPSGDLARISSPTTLIHGRHDLQVDLEQAVAASARHGWPLHVIDEARDDPAAECPAEFVAALRAALARGPT